MRREAFKSWDLVRPILKTLRYYLFPLPWIFLTRAQQRTVRCINIIMLPTKTAMHNFGIFLVNPSEQTMEESVELSMIWKAMNSIWRHCNFCIMALLCVDIIQYHIFTENYFNWCLLAWDAWIDQYELKISMRTSFCLLRNRCFGTNIHGDLFTLPLMAHNGGNMYLLPWQWLPGALLLIQFTFNPGTDK